MQICKTADFSRHGLHQNKLIPGHLLTLKVTGSNPVSPAIRASDNNCGIFISGCYQTEIAESGICIINVGVPILILT